MIPEQQMVEEFHKAFDIKKAEKPIVPDRGTQTLRLSLILEELCELEDAFLQSNIVKVADAIGDILYVTYGTAVSCGIDMDPIFREIHRSNMTKVGGHKREDGKWVKPATYSKADLGPILRDQGAEA